MTYEMTLFFRQFWIDPRLTWGKQLDGNNITNTYTEYKRADDRYNVAADMVDLIWIPDSFFIDEIGIYPIKGVCLDRPDVSSSEILTLLLESRRHSIMKRNVFLEIHPNGYVLLSERLSLKLKCPMHLRYYPFDLQICPIRIESYAFRDTQVSASPR